MDDILNYIQLTEKIGTSGQPTREQFRQIADAGYTSVINLAMPDSDHAIADEGAVVSALGLKYLHLPVPWDDPTAGHLKSFMRLMTALEGEKVWVHCAANYRVSAFMYHYLRMEKGWDDEAARNPQLQRWEPKMDAAWSSFMKLGPDDL